jgi:hypothetical protein
VAVLTVCEATGASGRSYGTFTARAASQNSTSLQSLKPTPKVLPISSEAKPVQSTNRSPSISPASRVTRLSMSPFSASLALRTLARMWRTPSFSTQCFCRNGPMRPVSK